VLTLIAEMYNEFSVGISAYRQSYHKVLLQLLASVEFQRAVVLIGSTIVLARFYVSPSS